MTITEEDAVSRLRSALQEMTTDAVDGALHDRLLAGVHRRRRARRAVTAAGAAALAGAGAGLVMAVGPALTPGSPEPMDGLVAGPAASDPLVVEGPPSRAGAVTREQAARAGLDGGPQCDSDAVRGAVQVGELGSSPPRVVAAYLTDTGGFEQWTAEFSSGVSSYRNGSPFGEGLVVLCWFEGDIPPDRSVPTGPDDPRHRLLAVQLEGPGKGMRLDTRSEEPIPVLAPPAPVGAPPAAARQGETVYPQPSGVGVVDQLRTPAPPPIDCLEREVAWTGC